MKELTHIGIASSAKVLTVLMGIVGLILGLAYSVGGAFYDVIVGQVSWGGTGLAFAAIPGMTAMFAGGGLAVGIIAPLFYNLLVRWTGGLKVGINPD
ncbi:MAG: hypothetical protein F4W95_06165 [Chloroflexi bacterium]|nr:hypothetical protein [Chloroflexota bacterium]MYD48053.1 hypothetical protein [Chloroflexota bacterium]